MERLGVINYLLQEIGKELERNAEIEKQEKAAERKAVADGKSVWEFRNYMAFSWEVQRKSIIRENAKTIRRLLLNYYK